MHVLQKRTIIKKNKKKEIKESKEIAEKAEIYEIEKNIIKSSLMIKVKDEKTCSEKCREPKKLCKDV